MVDQSARPRLPSRDETPRQSSARRRRQTEPLSAILADGRAIGRGNDTGKGRHKDKHLT